nr:MAG TPA: GNAT family acetyltransferase [Caudoviricetes sp.]
MHVSVQQAKNFFKKIFPSLLTDLFPPILATY